MARPTDSYDAIFVGTGFATTFFLSDYLQRAKPSARVLILERGRRDTHAWQIQHRQNSSTPAYETFVNRNPAKKWWYTPSFGGGSNCWWAITPRFMPNDFRMKSKYGVGADWPIGYGDLEGFYQRVEDVMAVSGPVDGAPYPRRKPHPQPPHRFTDPDRLLKAAYPSAYFHQPTARARIATKNRRACCASGVCDLCPVDAKFTILNEMAALYDDPRVELLLEARALTVETAAGVATGVTYHKDGAAHAARADLVVLGANAIFNPHILMCSSLNHPMLGKGLNEQVAVSVNVDLRGVDNFQGSTSVTGMGWMLYDGEHRARRAACVIESFNMPYLRLERGKWRQWLILKFTFEDLPSEKNYVAMNAATPDLPETIYAGHSDYTQRGIDSLKEALPKLLAPLPVEKITIRPGIDDTVFHIHSTTVMGDDPRTSVIDKHLVHHQVRNLVVLGSGAFPTAPPAHPTLTLCALSLWSAAYVLS